MEQFSLLNDYHTVLHEVEFDCKILIILACASSFFLSLLISSLSANSRYFGHVYGNKKEGVCRT